MYEWTKGHKKTAAVCGIGVVITKREREFFWRQLPKLNELRFKWETQCVPFFGQRCLSMGFTTTDYDRASKKVHHYLQLLHIWVGRDFSKQSLFPKSYFLGRLPCILKARFFILNAPMILFRHLDFIKTLQISKATVFKTNSNKSQTKSISIDL